MRPRRLALIPAYPFVLLLLLAAPHSAQAEPVDIGAFGWDEFIGPTFSVVNFAGSGGDFLDIVVRWTLIDDRTEEEWLGSLSPGDPGTSTLNSTFYFHEDIASATLSFRFVAPGTDEDLAGTLSVPVLTSAFESQPIRFDAAVARVPEPSSLLLVATGLAALAARRRRISRS